MRVVVLVSGGADSVCLLSVAIERLGADAIVVLHVDHGLRDGSRQDAAFVVALCESLGVTCVVERLSDAPVGNVQAWAREARYRLAFALGDEVWVGHTATDQVETVLYRLAASPGRRALLGMAERSGGLVRPLLGMTRAEVEAHCVSRGLAWLQDPTNASDRYARNRVRAGVVPALRAVHPAAEINVLRTLGVLRDEAEVLDSLVASTLEECGFDGVSVSRSALAAVRPALARLVLQALADGAARGTSPVVGDWLPELLALSGGTKGLDMGAGLRGVVSYDRVSVVACGEPCAQRTSCSTPLATAGRTPFLTGAVSAEPARAAGPRHPDVIDAHGSPLTLRTRQPGDRMRPINLGGSKSLQDLFTDRKVPRDERDAWPVVCAGDEVVWVPGVATAEAVRVTDATREALRLRWHRVRSGTA